MFQKLNAFENLGCGDSKSLIILSVFKATIITTAFSRKLLNFKLWHLFVLSSLCTEPKALSFS